MLFARKTATPVKLERRLQHSALDGRHGAAREKGNGPLDNPFLTVFKPPPGKRNGSSVIVAPGGGNIMLMYGAEGMDIAEQYNGGKWGVTAFVLTYRMSPAYNTEARSLDGKRAYRCRFARVQRKPKLDPGEDRLHRVLRLAASADAAVHVVTAGTAAIPNCGGSVHRAAELQAELSGVCIWCGVGAWSSAG